MPFVRFSRDKNGYEHVYLVHTPARGGSSRSRVIYWFRTPPGVKVGREPFDQGVRAALEARYPELTFDWKAITEAQAPPPPEVEPWRERRRTERLAKQAKAAGRADLAPPEAPPEATAEVPGDEVQAAGNRPEVAREADEPGLAISSPAPDAGAVAPANGLDQAVVGRRRRRGGRRRRRGSDRPEAASSGMPSAEAAPSPASESAVPPESATLEAPALHEAPALPEASPAQDEEPDTNIP